MIKGTEVSFTPEEEAGMLDRLQTVVKSGFFIWGDQQEEFQKRLAEMTEQRHAMTYSHVTLAAEAVFNILKPKVVVVQGNQFPSVIYAAKRQGADIKWVDISLRSLTVTVEELENAWPFDLLVLQHTGGLITDEIWDIRRWCHGHGVFLFEDASQAFGTEKDGHYAGHWGDVAVISFSATKFLTTGGQGAIVLFDDKALWDPMFRRKAYGRTELFQKGQFVEQGWNGQMSEVQAACGNGLMDFYQKNIDHRSKIAAAYEEIYKDTYIQELGDHSGSPNWYKYPIGLPGNVTRSVFVDIMLKNGVQMSSCVYDKPVYKFESFKGEYEGWRKKNTEVFSDQHVCLPMTNKMTLDDASQVVHFVTHTVRNWDMALEALDR